MKGLLVLAGAALTAGCGFAVVGDRCPGLAACDPQAADGAVGDGLPLARPPRDGLDPDRGAPDGGPASQRLDGGGTADADGAAGDGGSGADDAGGGASDGACAAGEQLCAGRRAAAFTDPDNCGSCGHVCLSGICLSGACQDAAFGHLVLLGHDFRQPGTNEIRELANAVLLSVAAPVRVAVYREHASAAAVDRVLTALSGEAARRGRSFVATLFLDRAAFTAALSGFDVALAVPQDQASNDGLLAAGTALEASFLAFVRAGGVLVVLDAPQPTCAGTWQLVRGLVAITGIVAVTGESVTVVAPADAVAVGLTATYRAAAHGGAFAYAGTGSVAQAPAGPVLIHEIVAP